MPASLEGRIGQRNLKVQRQCLRIQLTSGILFPTLFPNSLGQTLCNFLSLLCFFEISKVLK